MVALLFQYIGFLRNKVFAIF